MLHLHIAIRLPVASSSSVVEFLCNFDRVLTASVLPSRRLADALRFDLSAVGNLVRTGVSPSSPISSFLRGPRPLRDLHVSRVSPADRWHLIDTRTTSDSIVDSHVDVHVHVEVDLGWPRW